MRQCVKRLCVQLPLMPKGVGAQAGTSDNLCFDTIPRATTAAWPRWLQPLAVDLLQALRIGFLRADRLEAVRYGRPSSRRFATLSLRRQARLLVGRPATEQQRGTG
jgi:hypothetical protein